MATIIEQSFLLAAWTLAGCVSSSIDRDLRSVEATAQLAEMSLLRSPDDPEVEERLRSPLDAESAVRIAILRSPALRAEIESLGVARGRWLQASLFANPTLEGELLPERDTALEVRAEYEITSLLFAPLRAHAAELELGSARFRSASAVVKLGYRVRSSFYALQAALDRQRVAARSLDAFAASRDAAVALMAAGNVTELEGASRVIAYEKAKITAARIDLEVADRREALQRLMGLQGAKLEWSVASSLAEAPEAEPETDDLEARAIDANLELKSTRARLEALARRTGLLRLEGWIPDVSVDVHGLYGDPEATEGSDDRWRFGGGVALSVPLFDRRQGEVVVAEAQFDSGLAMYEAQAIELRSAARDVRNRLISTGARARHYEQVIGPAQRKILEQAILQYNAMQISVFELLRVRRDQLEVELAQIEARREYWTAVAALNAIVSGQRVTPMPTEDRTMESGEASSEVH